nr:major facilitator superfamily domain-containing protein 6-like [Cherax quadricarinatus]
MTDVKDGQLGSATERRGAEENGAKGGGLVLRWWTRCRKHMTLKQELLPIKVILFLFYAGQTSYLPYLTLHMQVLGITVKEIAIIYSFLPIASLLGPPTSGLVADTFGRYKSVMMVNMVLTVVFHVSLLYVPQRSISSLSLTCRPDNDTLTWAACDLCHHNRSHTQFELTLKDCRFLCESPPEEEQLRVCLSNDHHTHCLALNVTDQVSANGTILSWQDDDICGHTWYDQVLDDQVYQRLTCQSQCQVECQVKMAPTCDHPDEPSNGATTFWVYFAIRMTGSFFLSSAFTMTDATCLALLKQYGGELGIQRLFSVVGVSLGPLISGFLVDKFSSDAELPDFSPALYFGGILSLLSILLISRLHFVVDMAGDTVMKDLAKLIVRTEVDVFLIMIMTQGASWGFIESFLFVYLKELGAPNYLLGLTMTVGNLVGLPFLIINDWLVERLSRPVIFIISFFTYAIRHFGYSSINDPWLAFPFEILEVFTYQLMWLAALSYCPLLAPKGLLATMTGLAGAIHYSLGRGVGALLGGFLISRYSTSRAFRIFGFISLACGFLYAIIHFTYLKKKVAEREAKHKDKEDTEEEEEEAMLGKKVYNTTVIKSATHSATETSH